MFGAFRSGTNYVRAIMELNYDVSVSNNLGGWKHVPVPALSRQGRWNTGADLILLVAKEPFGWLVSLWKYAAGPGGRHVDAPASWSEFLESPLKVTRGNVEGFPSYRFSSPVDYWNAINWNLLSIPEPKRLVVRYEDVLRSPAERCAQVAATWTLQRRARREFVTPPATMRNLVDRPRSDVREYVTEVPFDPAPYLERSYLDGFSSSQLEMVARALDDDVVAGLEYQSWVAEALAR